MGQFMNWIGSRLVLIKLVGKEATNCIDADDVEEVNQSYRLASLSTSFSSSSSAI